MTTTPRPLLAILLLLPLSFNAGELDCKAISCDGGDYEFRGGRTVSWMIWVIGSWADLSDYPELASNYHTPHSTVWSLDVSKKKNKFFEYTPTKGSLDRKRVPSRLQSMTRLQKN